MGGSRPGSRPQRQSKSAVSYRERDDDDFLPNAIQSAEVSGRKNSLRNNKEEVEIAKGRRSLALKRQSRSQEPSPVRESFDATKDASYYSSERPKVEQIVHIDEEVLKLQRESSAFQYLLDVASEARANGKSEAAPVEYREEETTIGIPKTRTEQDAVTGSDVLEEELLKVVGIKADKEQEDLDSRKLKNIQTNSGPKEGLNDVGKFDGVDNDDNGNQSSVDKEEEEEADEEEDDSWDESSDASDQENKSNTKSRRKNTATAKQHKGKQHNKVPKVSEDQVKNLMKTCQKTGRAPAPASPVNNGQQLLPKKRQALCSGKRTCSSPGGTPLNVQAPSTAHRRVVGLSRRHRPPPLHPYLVGSEM